MELYDIINKAGGDGEFEILTECPVNLAQDSSASLNCLLVENVAKQSQTPERRTRNIHFVRLGQLGGHNRVTCDFLNLLLGQAQAQALQNDSITQEIRENSKHGGQDPRYLDAYKRLQEKALSVVDQLEAELDAAGQTLPDSGLGFTHQRHNSILGLLSRFYRKRYLVKERDFPVTQEYCLD